MEYCLTSMAKLATFIIFMVCATFIVAEIALETEDGMVAMEAIGSRLTGDIYVFADYFENLVENQTYYECSPSLNFISKINQVVFKASKNHSTNIFRTRWFNKNKNSNSLSCYGFSLKCSTEVVGIEFYGIF